MYNSNKINKLYIIIAFQKIYDFNQSFEFYSELFLFLIQYSFLLKNNSTYNENFILKGGLLISSMIGIGERTTMDMDTTVRGIPMDKESIVKIVKEILLIKVDDEINFSFESIEPIREDDEYENFRVHLKAMYGKINAPMKIDITTGDIITPKEIRYSFPLSFENKTIPIMAYSLETVLAEKYETIIRRNIATTRARDFYDLYTLYILYKSKIRVKVLKEAIINTANKRNSIEVLKDWKEIVEEMKEEKYLISIWNNYQNENNYAQNLSYENILFIIEEISKKIKL